MGYKLEIFGELINLGKEKICLNLNCDLIKNNYFYLMFFIQKYLLNN